MVQRKVGHVGFVAVRLVVVAWGGSLKLSLCLEERSSGFDIELDRVVVESFAYLAGSV